MSALSPKQRRHLRGLGHHLQPVVQVGKGGVTDGVIAAVDDALTTHELIKVRRGNECPEERAEVEEKLAVAAKAAQVGHIGHTFLLYRRHPEKPVIELPR